MRLLDLLPLMEVKDRIKRQQWDSSSFLMRDERCYRPLILVDLTHMIIKEYLLRFDELISDDWEFIS